MSIDDIGATVVLIGRLGQQLGEQITITGHPLEAGVAGDEFVVESVNGVRRRWGIIKIPGTKAWPSDADVTLRGCEVAKIRFYLGSNRGPEDGNRPHQKAITTFEVEEVVAPVDLKLNDAEINR